jgi:peptidoglycan/xylan/chitin deacetylase (PgdA/CDA1 family)
MSASANIKNFLFPNGLKKCLTLSYDDGTLFDRDLIKIMNKYSIRGTFHLNAGFLERNDHIGKDEIPSLYKGHEISAHGHTHPSLALLPKDAVIHEIIEDRKKLEAIVKHPVCGMSYPNGSFSESVINTLKMLGIKYSRTTKATHSYGLPDNHLAWHPTAHHSDDILQKAEEFTQMPEKRLYIFYLWGHSYEFDRNNNWELIEEFCKKMSGNNRIWYATNIEIVNYIECCNRLHFSADNKFVYNPSAQSVWLEVNGEPVEISAGETKTLA